MAHFIAVDKEEGSFVVDLNGASIYTEGGQFGKVVFVGVDTLEELQRWIGVVVRNHLLKEHKEGLDVRRIELDIEKETTEQLAKIMMKWEFEKVVVSKERLLVGIEDIKELVAD